MVEILQNHSLEACTILDLIASGSSCTSNSRDFLNAPLHEDKIKFAHWVGKKYNADMHFLSENSQVRNDTNLILQNAQTALIFAVPYASGKRVRGKVSEHLNVENIDSDINQTDSILSQNLICRYAQVKDYHKALKKNLTLLAQDILKSLKIECEFRVVVDSVPFLERAHGRHSGLGFVGKNTMLIRPGMGSYFFIATLLFTAKPSEFGNIVESSNAIFNLSCGDCTKCLDACPTQALTNAYELDAAKCISYLSIEKRDTVDNQYLKSFKDTLYGCDICQEVCPYNFVTSDFKKIRDFQKKHSQFSKITAIDIAKMDTHQYEMWFGGTAATRAKYGGLVRNALYHLWATARLELQDIVAHRIGDQEELIAKTCQQLMALLNEIGSQKR